MKHKLADLIAAELRRAKNDATNDRATLDDVEVRIANVLMGAFPATFDAKRFYSAAWTPRTV